MIIQKVFHTYKDDFPLLLPNQKRISFNGNALYKLMTNLILELSDLAAIIPFSYISRHTNDKIPPEHLTPFLTKFSSFVNASGKDQLYNIPTIWFVGHFKDYESAAEVKKRIDIKNVKYFDKKNEYDSFEQINETYWEEKNDAELFIKFLHQTTMIGIDLLKTADYKQKLGGLGRLEYMQYTSMEDAKSDFKEMELYLRKSSPYYIEHISADGSEYKEFWVNFTKWKSSKAGTGSWPHFLFNICGLPYPSRLPPLKINTDELFTGWW